MVAVIKYQVLNLLGDVKQLFRVLIRREGTVNSAGSEVL
jgi:hypothetical protein